MSTPIITVKTVLEFEATGPGGFGPGAQQRVRDVLGISLIGYHQILTALVNNPEQLRRALAIDPVTTNRLLERRDAAIAARERATGRLQA